MGIITSKEKKVLTNVVLWKSVDWNRTWTLYAFNAPAPQLLVVVDGLAVTPSEMTVITVNIALNGELHPIVVSQVREVW